MEDEWQTLKKGSGMFRIVVLLVLAIGFFALPSFSPSGPRAETLSAEERAINAVIEAQLAAFKRHDAEAAFSHAAPDIQARFQTAENFIAAVATQYLPLYSPKRVAFLGLVQEDGATIQRLKVLGPEGGEYIAYYPMERQSDGVWKIGGCHLEPVAGLDA